MKTRIHPQSSPRRPARSSISYRVGFLAAFNVWLCAWLRRIGHAVVEIAGAGSRRSNHLRLVRRNGRPIPVPLRTVVKTRNPRIGGIVVAVLVVLSLAAAGIGGSIYLGQHTPAVSLLQ